MITQIIQRDFRKWSMGFQFALLSLFAQSDAMFSRVLFSSLPRFAGHPSSSPFLGTCSPFSPLEKCSVLYRKGAWRGAAPGCTSPQISGMKFLHEICARKRQMLSLRKIGIMSMPTMTGRLGHRTMEMNGGSSVPYLARTPCVPLFSILFKRGGNRRAFRLPRAGGDHFHCTVEPSPGHIRCRLWNNFSETLPPKPCFGAIFCFSAHLLLGLGEQDKHYSSFLLFRAGGPQPVFSSRVSRNTKD